LQTIKTRLISVTGRVVHAFQIWSDGSGARAVRGMLPPTLRSFLNRRRHQLSRIPVRFLFPEASATEGAVRVVIYGTFADNWLPRLGDAATWKEIPSVAEVLLVADDPSTAIPGPFYSGSRTVIVPLSENNINNCPRDYPALIPNRHATDTLGNKAAFAAYVDEHNLSDLCPTTYKTKEQAEFPCILKRVNTAYGLGSVILRSAQELEALLRNEALSQEEFILQSLVAGTTEYSTHCVCKDGRILWSCSFVFEMDGPEEIRRGMECKEMRAIKTSDETLSTIERVLAPLGYSGPCNIDYKRSEAGAIIIFEINPRFGGSLMLTENIGHLREALSCIIENAGEGTKS
jgi:hypothetical protein